MKKKQKSDALANVKLAVDSAFSAQVEMAQAMGAGDNDEFWTGGNAAIPDDYQPERKRLIKSTGCIGVVYV